MSDKSCCWSITINNPTPDDFHNWESLKGIHWVRSATGQLEKGENETPHLQGMVKTQSVRFSALKKALPRAHIEKARNEVALTKYVSKEETRIAPIPTAKVANQADVQKRCLRYTLQYCYAQEGESFDVLSIEDQDLISRHELRIKQHWEAILDEAVSSLIFEGYYGVEFVVSNPQVRTAFKKYFIPIMYRTLNARDQEIQARNEALSEAN